MTEKEPYMGVLRDTVTGLETFETFLQKAQQILQSHEFSYVVIATDFSNFKYINRIYGHAMGNDILQDFADYACRDNPNCVLACRPYSDHIVGVFITECRETTLKRIEEMNQRFIKKHRQDLPLVSLHMNTGVYFVEDMDEKVSVMVDKANIARRSMKGHYHINYVEYTKELNIKTEEDAFLLPLFEAALQDEEIVVLLQPKISIKTKKAIGAEALSRLVDKSGRIITPVVFIPILEKTGRVLELDRYVMRKVFQMIRRWLDEGRTPVRISVNLSKLHFYNENLAQDIIREYEKYHIPSEYVEFEITETVFLEEIDLLIEKIEILRKYGFKISVDDFGAGYSSLNLLGMLPADIIKLDKGFVKNSLVTARGRDIMKGLIEILNRIQMEIICEGVETEEEEKTIAEYGCKEVQGYLYDKPIPIEKFEKKYFI